MRLPDWEARLARLVERRQECEFCWGIFDCAIFAADAVVAVTGLDPITELRGMWHTRRAALRVARDIGGYPNIVSYKLGPPVKYIRTARVGDIVLTGGDSLAVVYGASALAPARFGLARIPMNEWREAWRVD